MLEEYAQYKKVVCREEYADVAGFEHRRAERENAWPEEKTALHLIWPPELLRRRDPLARQENQDGVKLEAPLRSKFHKEKSS